jgi:hypothetical protein
MGHKNNSQQSIANSEAERWSNGQPIDISLGSGGRTVLNIRINS